MIKPVLILGLICASQSLFAQQKIDTLKEFTKVNISFSDDEVLVKKDSKPMGENLGEVLQQTSSAFIKTYGQGGISSLSIRGGSASQTQVFWNGIAINSPTLGQSDLSLIPVEFMDEVSLNPGSSATLYGDGGIGGSLVIQNKNRFVKQKSIKLSADWGSYFTENKSAELVIGDSIYFFRTVVVSKKSANNFHYNDYSQLNSPQVTRENAETRMSGAQQQMGFRKGKYIFGANASFISLDRNIPVAIGVGAQNQKQEDRSLKLQANWNSYSGKDDQIRHKVNIGFVDDYLRFSNVSSQLDSEFKTKVLTAQYHTVWYLPNSVKLRSQLNGYQFRADSDGFIDLKKQNRLSAFVDVEKKLKKWSINGSLRQLMIDGKLVPIVPTFGVAWKRKKSQYLYGNMGKNYSHPSLNDLYWRTGGNINLLPEEALQGELGFKTSSKENRLTWDANVFYGVIDNWIQWVPSNDGLWRPQNVKNVEKKGVLTKVDFMFMQGGIDQVRISGQYQSVTVKAMESEIANDEGVGKDLIYSPRHRGNIQASWKHKNFTALYSQSFTSKLFLDATNLSYLPYSAPANLRCTQTFKTDKSKVKLSVGINNIFNETYQTVANQPLPGRYYSLGFSLQFHE